MFPAASFPCLRKNVGGPSMVSRFRKRISGGGKSLVPQIVPREGLHFGKKMVFTGAREFNERLQHRPGIAIFILAWRICRARYSAARFRSRTFAANRSGSGPAISPSSKPIKSRAKPISPSSGKSGSRLELTATRMVPPPAITCANRLSRTLPESGDTRSFSPAAIIGLNALTP